MVPESRVQDGSCPIPKLLIGKEDISKFIDELEAFMPSLPIAFPERSLGRISFSTWRAR